MKSLWRRRHLILAIMWVCLLVPALLWWKESVLFVIILSIYANFEASLATYASQKEAHKQKERNGES